MKRHIPVVEDWRAPEDSGDTTSALSALSWFRFLLFTAVVVKAAVVLYRPASMTGSTSPLWSLIIQSKKTAFHFRTSSNAVCHRHVLLQTVVSCVVEKKPENGIKKITLAVSFQFQLCHKSKNSLFRMNLQQKPKVNVLRILYIYILNESLKWNFWK